MAWREHESNQLQQWMPQLTTILHAVVDGPVFLEDLGTGHGIAILIASHALRRGIPSEYYPALFRVASDFRSPVVKRETPALASDKILVLGERPTVCYVVFAGGTYEFHCGRLTGRVLSKRESILFWINHATGDYLSRGIRRRKLRPQTECLLRFLCSEQIAGGAVSRLETYLRVWRKQPPNSEQIANSIQVELSALNHFTGGQLLRPKDNGIGIRHKGDNLVIDAGLMNECCIIEKVTDGCGAPQHGGRAIEGLEPQ